MSGENGLLRTFYAKLFPRPQTSGQKNDPPDKNFEDQKHLKNPRIGSYSQQESSIGF